jgi:hypothetical protein
MSSYNEISVSVDNNQDNIVVYIDETGKGIKPILNFISLLSSNYNVHQQVMSTVLTNSAAWEETYHEVNTIQNSISADWHETFQEVNTIQEKLSAQWQKSYDVVQLGIVDGGNF